jgi:RHS repeat-associated protein
MLFTFCLLLWPQASIAQNVQHTENKPDQAMKGDFRVDPSTLGMSMTIPLGSYAGRGGLGVPVSLTYSSKLWRIGFQNTWESTSGTTYTWTDARYAETSASGWTSSLDIPFVEFTGREQLYDGEGQGVCELCNPSSASTYSAYYIKRLNVHLPDGSAHELRTDDAGHLHDPQNPMGDFSGVYYAVDGSRMKYDTSAHTLFLPDGSRYLFGATEIAVRGRVGLPATQYVDRHGNTITYNAAARQWTDTLGRAVSNPLPDRPTRNLLGETYYLTGVGGHPLAYKFYWLNLSEALTASQPTRPSGNKLCGYPTSGNVDGATLFQSSGFSYVCADQDAQGNAKSFDPVVLSRIVLPTGQEYRFTYNVYGEIDKAYLPTGGSERYAYGAVAPLAYATAPYEQSNRGVTDRWVSVDGLSETMHWQYALTGATPYTVRVTAPDGAYTERSLHASRVTVNGPPIKYGMDDARAGMAYEERAYSATGQMLRRTLTGWATVTPDGSSTPRNPHVTKTVELLLDTGGNALASTTEMHYDDDLNVDSTQKYDYASVAASTAQTGAIGAIPAGALVRTDETTYVVNDPAIPAATRDAYEARNMLGLPSSSRVKNAADLVVARSEIKYDEAAYPLLTYGAVTGWSDPGTSVRGLATTSRSWLDTSAAWVETHARYDQLGNVRYAWDARGNVSEVEYAPAYHYAYPTLTRTAIPDPSNNRATNTALVSTTVYDFSTGRVTSTKDANGQVNGLSTTYEYNDVLDRLTKVNSPDGGWTTYWYDRNAHGDYIGSRTAINATQNTESYQFFDGLGRGVRSFGLDGNQWVTTDTEYDTMGRVRRISNPYLSAGSGTAINPSGNWTTNAYDALGRVLTVTTPDNAAVTTSYSGNSVTVADQVGKRRRSVTDALGRLTTVYEDPAGVNYGTSYNYDVLGNLRKVEQGGQLRFFMYDSLGRLIRARNPEQAANPNLATSPDPISGNTQWSLSYAYDANGNLSSRTDARGVTTANLYDNLNRLIQTTYSDGTPYTLRTYDFAANGRGRFYADYESSTSGTINYVLAYDAMGRPTSGQTEFYLAGWGWRPAYTTSRAYDLMGHVTTQTYPSGHTVNYNQFDTAGRLKNMTGNLGDGVTRTYAAGIGYDPAGRLQQEQFGTQTALHHKLHYNVRGQLNDIRLSTVPWATDQWNWNRGGIINYYAQNDLNAATNEARASSGADNNGNVILQQHWVPNDDQMSGYQWMNQYYTYDALNRLASVTEQASGATNTGAQVYAYDRFGNRTVDAAQTWGAGIPEPQFTVDAATNRLGVPVGQTGAMTYDPAGNLTHDSYTGKGNRTYDAENRMTSAVSDIYGNSSVYTYDAAGKRVRRQTPTQNVWQVSGFDGELLVEYAANSAPAQPQKEYAYRNGELLVTAESGGQVNWLVTDHLGTPRIIADLSGSLANIKRHDYLPFGEEIGAGVGDRTAAQGYTGDDVRQQFTGYERDDETGLDYAQARYYASMQGRFTSVDPSMRSASISDPQSFNRYVYVSNNPLSLTDPTGLSAQDPQKKKCPEGGNCDENGNLILDTGAPVTVTDTLPKPTAYPNNTPVYENPWYARFGGWLWRGTKTVGRGVGGTVARAGGAALMIFTVLPSRMAMPCGPNSGREICDPPTMSNEPDVDTSANPDPEDNKPDTSENEEDGNKESRKGDKKSNKETTPTTHSGDFEPVRGRDARRNKSTGEIWVFDRFHKNHYEVYKNLRDFERGRRNRAVWSDGRPKPL